MHALGHRPAEADVLVDRVHPQPRILPVGDSVQLPDQPVMVEDRQRKVAPASLGRGLVHLQLVLEVEQLLCADAVVDQPVERRQQCGTTLELLTERRWVDHPAARRPLDLGRLSLDLLEVALPGHADHLRAGNAQSAHPP